MISGLRAAIAARLAAVHPPQGSHIASANSNTGADADIVSLGLVSDIFIADGKAFFSITVPADEAPAWEETRAQAEKCAAETEGVRKALVSLTAAKAPDAAAQGQNAAPGHAPVRLAPGHQTPLNEAAPHQGVRGPAKQPLPGVRHIIAVASGKGGVGKSTVAVNLAAALAVAGYKTGLLDADIYGPSLPQMMGIVKPRGVDIVPRRNNKLEPLARRGLKLMSMGFLVEAEAPLVWRGPMVMGAVRQLLQDVAWAPLDILVVDMPPGTGDAQLSLAQKVPLSGAIIVSTPQELALADARKAIEMFHKVHVPILGLVENMSCFIAPDTGKHYAIFGGLDAEGKGGAEREAAKRGLPFLGALPLNPEIGAAADKGEPLPLAQKSGAFNVLWQDMAAKIAGKLRL